MALTLQLCPSPDLIGCYAQQDWDSTLVVITDVFRASATILSALYHGAIEVQPVATVEVYNTKTTLITSWLPSAMHGV